MIEPSPRPGLFTLAATLLLMGGCGSGDTPPSGEPPVTTGSSAAATPGATPAAAFLANLNAHCGQAFPGALAIEPPGDEMLDGDELLVVHVRGCGVEEMLLPFHIETDEGIWDRSRTWIFRLTDGNRLELRHDHRQPDGTEDDVTWYGAFTLADGTPTQQEFLRDTPAADGSIRGWRVIIEPGVRYIYGTIRDGEWTWRVDFDLSTPMTERPPPPWGYEDGSGPPR
jgi:hypothetical protein